MTEADEGAEGKLRTKLAPYMSPSPRHPPQSLQCDVYDIPQACLAALKEKQNKLLTDRDHSPARQESSSVYKYPSDLHGRTFFF